MLRRLNCSLRRLQGGPSLVIGAAVAGRFGVPSHPFLQRRHISAVAPPAQGLITRGLDADNGISFDIGDLKAYPPYSAGAVGHLVKALNELRDSTAPVITENTEEVVDFTWNWQRNTATLMVPAHAALMKAYTSPTVADVASRFLDEMLNNVTWRASTPLIERDDVVARMSTFIQRAFTGQPKRSLQTLFSTRGSGKTQLVKYCLYAVAQQQIVDGSVLVCESSMARAHFKPALDTLKAKGASVEHADIEAFVVGLIRAHLVWLKKTPLDASVDTIRGAYAVWSQQTGCKFPLIVFDTVEALPQATNININGTHAKGKRGLIEAMAFLLPAQHSMLAVGSKRAETSDILNPTDVVLDELASLPTLTCDGFRQALVRSWGTSEKDLRTASTKLFHYLGGGAPRLMERLSGPVRVSRLNIIDSWGAVLTDSIHISKRGIGSGECPSAGPSQRTMWALCALVSGTKLPVRPSDPMPLLENTRWEDAMQGLLFARGGCKERDGKRVLRMPPLLTMTSTAQLMFDELARGKNLGELHQWPTGLDAAFLHVPAEKDALDSLSFCDFGAAVKGMPYEKVVANAMVGRWYLLSLLTKNEKRIPLSLILDIKDAKPRDEHDEDPYDERLKSITVDFSGGLLENADQSFPLKPTDHGFVGKNGTFLQRCGAGNGHHVLRFAARVGSKSIVVAVQIRGGTIDTAPSKQCCTVANGRKKVDLLLSVTPQPRKSQPGSEVLEKRCVFVEGNRFCDHDGLSIHI